MKQTADDLRELVGQLEDGSVESTPIQRAYLRGALDTLQALIAQEDYT